MSRIDLHVHTEYSSDGLLRIERLVQLCPKRGLDRVAVTDHNTIEGALRLAEAAPFPVIIGEEIRTADGEIIGLFLEKEIPRDLPIERTIELIREQNGVVYLPHPCDRMRRSKIRQDKLRDIVPLCDAIEVFNARNVFGPDNAEAEKLAEEFGLPQGVGSDAHTWMELGNCYVEMDDFDGPTDFLEKLRSGTRITKKSSLVVHGITKTVKAWNSIGHTNNQ